MSVENRTAEPEERIPKRPSGLSAAERLRAELPSMKDAVIWAEILDRPLSRRGRR